MNPPEKQEFSCQNINRPDLLLTHRRGLIPGPKEADEAFARRTKTVKTKQIYSLLSLSPDWISVTIETKGLPFWEGATTWIEEAADRTRSCSIQPKPLPSFFYSQKEILTHELVHAIRLQFDEPRFEEILAFRTAKHPLRRYAGPLFTRASESLLFMILLGLSWAGYCTGLFFDAEELGFYALYLPLPGFFLCLLRLVRAQTLFSQALRKMKRLISNPEQGLEAMLYLTDKEILFWATRPKLEILHYLQKANSLRLKQFSENFRPSDDASMRERC